MGANDADGARGSIGYAWSARALIALLREGRPVRFVARGASMWPAVRDGALVGVTPCAPDALRAGELLAYEREGQLVVHRVLGREGGSLRCAGDALAAEDAPVASEQVLGRAEVLRSPSLTLRLPRVSDLVVLARWGRAWWRRRR